MSSRRVVSRVPRVDRCKSGDRPDGDIRLNLQGSTCHKVRWARIGDVRCLPPYRLQMSWAQPCSAFFSSRRQPAVAFGPSRLVSASRNALSSSLSSTCAPFALPPLPDRFGNRPASVDDRPGRWLRYRRQSRGWRAVSSAFRHSTNPHPPTLWTGSVPDVALLPSSPLVVSAATSPPCCTPPAPPDDSSSSTTTADARHSPNQRLWTRASSPTATAVRYLERSCTINSEQSNGSRDTTTCFSSLKVVARSLLASVGYRPLIGQETRRARLHLLPLTPVSFETASSTHLSLPQHLTTVLRFVISTAHCTARAQTRDQQWSELMRRSPKAGILRIFNQRSM